MERCFMCGADGEFTHANRPICKKCFVLVFEKRVKSTLRENPLQKDDKVLVVGELAAFLLKLIVKMPIDVETANEVPVDVGNYDKVILGWTLDDECAEFMEKFASEFRFDDDEKLIKILKRVTDDESEQYSSIKGVDFKAKKSKLWKGFMHKFDRFHEVRYNLLRSAEEMKKVMK